MTGPVDDISKKINSEDEGKERYMELAQEYGANVVDELKDHLGEVLSDTPPLFVVAHSTHRQVKIAGLKQRSEIDEKGKIIPDTQYMAVEYRDVALDGIPCDVIEYFNPLTRLTKYSMTLETRTGLVNVSDKPLPLHELVKEVAKIKECNKPRSIADYLHPIIRAYFKGGKAKRVTEIEQSGFFMVDGKLVMSKVACMADGKESTKEQVRDALNFIDEVRERFYTTEVQVERLAHKIKWGLVAPFDFARRQVGIATKANNYLPRMDLYGESDAGKTYGTKYLVLGLYGLAYDDEYRQPYGACDTQPRFINKTGWTTMPIIIDEVDELTHWNKDRHAERMLSLLKNQATMIAPRTTLTKESDEITGYSLSPYILTHNSDRIDEDGFLKRVTSIGYTTTDKKNSIQIKQFENYMQNNIERYVHVGKFAINYVMQNQDILKERWTTIADRILDAMYSFAESERPAWLSATIANTQKEDLADHRRGLIRQLLVNLINDSYLKHRHGIEETFSSVGHIDQSDLMSKFQGLLAVKALPEFHLNSKGELFIMSPIKTHLEKAGLDRVSTLKAFAELCGFAYHKQKKINGRNIPAAVVNLTDFAAFLAINLEEPAAPAEGQTTLPPARN